MMSVKALAAWPLALLWAILLAALPLQADEPRGDKAEEKGPRCLSMARIQRIEIIDDETLRFHMRGRGPDYLNRLPRRCSGLKRQGTFMHATSTQNYCDLDTITQIDTTLGMRLGSCPLGKFEEVTELEEGRKSRE